MRMIGGVAGVAGLVLLGACGGGGSDSSGPNGGSGFTATIDGQAWEATPISIAANPVLAVPGALLITGVQTVGNTTTGVTLTLYNITGPGTYPLGVSSNVYGGTGQVGESNDAWITDNTGTAGTVTITTLSASHIVGSFAFDAVPGHHNVQTNTRVVTNGHFDLPFGGALTPVPENVGSKVTATMGGTTYIAWSVDGLLQDHLGGAGFQFSSSTRDHGLSILISGAIQPGTYTLSNTGAVRIVSAGRNGGDAAHCCWGGGNTGNDVGTITITSITSERVKGTLTATLQPVPNRPATTPLVITAATFDVGIP
jgi:hypothetical protein